MEIGFDKSCRYLQKRRSLLVLWDFGLRYASRVGGAGSGFLSPCRVVSGQDASGKWDVCMRSRWLWSISPTQIWVWLLRNAGF